MEAHMTISPEPRRANQKTRQAMTSRNGRQVCGRTLLSRIRGAMRRDDGSGLLVMVLVALVLIGRLLKVM
jgi:hypothetical protein